MWWAVTGLVAAAADERGAGGSTFNEVFGRIRNP
jgi:hypothetical protein